MARPNDTPAYRALSRVWVLSLQHRLEATVPQLNQQLVLVPEPGRPFVLGRSPRPLPEGAAEGRFERTLVLQKDPDTCNYKDLDGQGQYNLVDRVSAHLPGSEEWLLRDLKPYLRRAFPPISYPCKAIPRILQRLGWRRASSNAVCFGGYAMPDCLAEAQQRQLATLASGARPDYLCLLFALFHEHQWVDPGSRHASAIGDACLEAAYKLFANPLFDQPYGMEARECLEQACRALYRQIKRRGHRSPELKAKVVATSGCRFLLCRDFDTFDDADVCSGLGYGIPLEQFRRPTLTAYSPQGLPCKSQSSKAFKDLLAHAVC